MPETRGDSCSSTIRGMAAGVLAVTALLVASAAPGDETEAVSAAVEQRAAAEQRIETAQRVEPSAATSVWEGVFTTVQAERGRTYYTGPCSHCHGYKLNGAPDDPDMFPTPPLAGAKFLRDWDGRSLAALFEYTRRTMPENNPSYLSDSEYADILAYMLAASGLPTGDTELTTGLASLARIVIRARPEDDPTRRPDVSAATSE